jgi:hypothetical protein
MGAFSSESSLFRLAAGRMIVLVTRLCFSLRLGLSSPHVAKKLLPTLLSFVRDLIDVLELIGKIIQAFRVVGNHY